MSGKYFQHDRALIAEGAHIGKGTRIWAFANIQEGAKIGEECNICDGVFIEGGAVIGNHVTVKNHVSVFDGVTIEDDCFIGANIAFINDRHPRSHREDEWTLEKTLVKKGATLGSNVTVMCGVTVGRYAMIGAGSVVTKDVSDHAVMTGNPARQAGYACVCGRTLSQEHACACACGRAFTLTDQGLSLNE